MEEFLENFKNFKFNNEFYEFSSIEVSSDKKKTYFNSNNKKLDIIRYYVCALMNEFSFNIRYQENYNLKNQSRFRPLTIKNFIKFDFGSYSIEIVENKSKLIEKINYAKFYLNPSIKQIFILSKNLEINDLSNIINTNLHKFVNCIYAKSS